jgi:pimeloyl-ACP methyl ester carboxylesterase
MSTDATRRLGDIVVAWTECGSGRPVVLVHGLAEDRRTWVRQQQALDGLHTFAYDLRGHGDSSLGDADGSLAQLGGDLVRFLEEVTGPAAVVGFSLGGAIALWAAAERADLVDGLVVLGTSSVVGRGAIGFYEDRIAKAGDPASQAFRDAVRDDTEAGLDRLPDESFGGLAGVVDARLRAVGDGRGYVNAARAMAALNAEPLTPRLGEIAQHVDVVGAAKDAFCPPKAAAIITDALTDATYHEIPDAGHLMNVDNPAAVTTVLRHALTGRN